MVDMVLSKRRIQSNRIVKLLKKVDQFHLFYFSLHMSRTYVYNIRASMKVLCLDLDGTLFYPRRIGRCISKRNVKFLRRWVDAGNKLALVTSRSEQFCERLKDEIARPFDLLSCTSAQIRADGELIRDVTVPNEIMEDVVNKVNRTARPLAILMTTRDYPCLIRDSHRPATKFLLMFYKLYWFFQFKYREPYKYSNKDFNLELKDGKIYKAMIFFGLGKKKNNFAKEMNKAFREQHPDVEFSWTAVVNEVTPKDCTKGSGLDYYCDYLKINKEDVYVVGDSGNDITMFNSYKNNSFCMKHASKIVRKYATHTVGRVYQLEKYLLPKEERKNATN